jgi:hypothetical protein
MISQQEVKLVFGRTGSVAHLIKIDGKRIKPVALSTSLLEMTVRQGVTVGLEICKKSRKTKVRVLDNNGDCIEERIFKYHWTCSFPVSRVKG